MKLSAALTKLKSLKSQLARTEKYLNSSLTHYEDQSPKYDYVAESTLRQTLIKDITSLKEQIQLTNSTTKVNLGGELLSITGLILLNANLRSELAHLAKLADVSVDSHSIYSERSKDALKKVYATGFDPLQAKREIDIIESKKELVEAVLARANMETDLI